MTDWMGDGREPDGTAGPTAPDESSGPASATTAASTPPKDAAARPAAKQTEGGTRRKPAVERHDWRASGGIASDSARMATLIPFADWLCAVNPEFDDKLPACWHRHPWLVLQVDAIHTEWTMAYTVPDGGSTPALFLHRSTEIFERIDAWAKRQQLLDQNHHCDTDNNDIGDKRVNRRRAAREDGYAPIHAHLWPWSEAADERAMDATAAIPWNHPQDAPLPPGDPTGLPAPDTATGPVEWPAVIPE